MGLELVVGFVGRGVGVVGGEGANVGGDGGGVDCTGGGAGGPILKSFPELLDGGAGGCGLEPSCPPQSRISGLFVMVMIICDFPPSESCPARTAFSFVESE